MFEIPFTQYLRPNGRAVPVRWECTSHEQEIKARALIDAGARFEVEQLQTGEASLTVEMLATDGEPRTLAHEVCPNDKAVIDAVVRLVEKAHESFINGALEI